MLAFCASVAGLATIAVIPYTFTPNTVIQSSQVNSNFTTLASVINGNLDNSNIIAGANINPSKLNLTTPYLNLVTASTILGFGVAQTGDTLARGGIFGDGSYQFGTGSAATDIGWKRSAANTIQLYIPNGGGTPALDLNSAVITNGGTLGLTTLTTTNLTVTNAPTFTAPPTIANGGTGAQTQQAAENAILGTGVTGQAPVYNGTNWVAGMPYWGGHGKDGAGALTTGSITGPIQKNYTTLSVANGQTITLDGAAPHIFNANSTVTISGTISASGTGGGGGSGGTGGNPSATSGGNGGGPGCGGAGAWNAATNSAGGGGGGFGGKGGRVKNNGAGLNYGPGGGTYSSSIGGGSGGGGGSAYGTAVGGAGAAGGGNIIVCAVGAVSLASTGVITNSGSAGSAGVDSASGTAGGGGGGSGGAVWLCSQTSVTTTAGGTITVAGGAGGAADTDGGTGGTASGGGGGGGGRIVLWSPTNTNGSTNSLAGGTGGSGNSIASESGGTTSAVTSVTGTPSLPLIGEIMKPGGHGGVFFMISDMSRGELRQYDVAKVMAEGDLVKFALFMSPSMSEGVNCYVTDAVPNDRS